MPPKWRAGHAQHAAADVPEVAGQRGQREDRAHRRAGAAVALQSEAEADRGRPRVREAGARARRRSRRGRPQISAARSTGHSARRASSSRPALGVALEPLAILGALVEHDAHEPERERGVGARARGDVLVAALGRVGAQRIDRDDVRAAALRSEHEAPLVQVRREQVGAPQDHELRVLEVLRIHADGAAVGRVAARARGGRADRRPQSRGAERGEQARPHDPALHHALGAREVVRQHGFGAVRARSRARRPAALALERLVPADLLELALALGADAAQRMRHAAGPVDGVQVAVDLGAERAVRERMLRGRRAARPRGRPRPRPATSRCPGSPAGRPRARSSAWAESTAGDGRSRPPGHALERT